MEISLSDGYYRIMLNPYSLCFHLERQLDNNPYDHQVYEVLARCERFEEALREYVELLKGQGTEWEWIRHEVTRAVSRYQELAI